MLNGCQLIAVQRARRFCSRLFASGPVKELPFCALPHDTGFELQKRVRSSVRSGLVRLFKPQVSQFRTPPPERTFQALHQSWVFGGWSAEGSDQYARIARQRCAYAQRSVVKCIDDRTQMDSFGGSEITRDFSDFLWAKGIDSDERTRCIKLLETWNRDRSIEPAIILEPLEPVPPEDLPIPDDDAANHTPAAIWKITETLTFFVQAKQRAPRKRELGFAVRWRMGFTCLLGGRSGCCTVLGLVTRFPGVE